MRTMRKHMHAIARLLVAVFVYALLLPPGSAPCIHHPAVDPAMASHAAMASAGRHADHGAPGDRGHASGHLGCGCCIGGTCGGSCTGGCRLPLGCAGCGGHLRLTRLDDDRPVAFRRAVADARVDLSAPLVRPQAPRAPPA